MGNHTVPITPPNEEVKVSEVERYFLIAWCLATLIPCLSGNIIVLVSSICYRAIKLDKITVILIQNIAVADLVSLIVHVN